jgi:hypothetical protein
MDLIDAFNERISLLNNMHYDEAIGRLAGFLDWLESEPITKGLVEQLQHTVNVDSLLQSNQRVDARPPGSISPPRTQSLWLPETPDTGLS